MLKPTSDRLDYGELLVPPAGYTLHTAVGTTYSLDFDALVGVCIALGLSESTNSELKNNPVYLLEALRKTSSRVAIFCDAGQIHVPANNSPLYILLEKMVFEVKVKEQRAQPKYPSFHPKFWLMKYISTDGSFLYRIIVLSRNLTFDRSWDVAVKLDGKEISRTSDRSKPISAFLSYLLASLPASDANAKEKRKMLKQLITEVLSVEFSSDMKEFSGVNFIPVGVGGYSMKNTPMFSDTFHEALIMSPFLSAGIIADFNQRNRNIENPKCTLITRRVSLEKLKPKDCDKFRIFTMRDEVIDGEAATSEDESGVYRQDIHAKVYMWCKNSSAELYLGSLNSSHSALNGNVEFMVQLISRKGLLNTDALTKSLFCGDESGPNNPFVLTKLPDRVEPTSDIESILSNRIRMLCRGELSATISEHGGQYTISIRIDKVLNTSGLTIAPLLSNKEAQVAAEVHIEGLSILQLSQFYRITATQNTNVVSRVIKIETEGIPDNRDSALVSKIIDNPLHFYQYVVFLLGDSYLVSALEASSMEQPGILNHYTAAIMPSLYERMLKTAATAPDRFIEMEYMMNLISADGVVPAGFTALFNTFRKAAKRRG